MELVARVRDADLATARRIQAYQELRDNRAPEAGDLAAEIIADPESPEAFLPVVTRDLLRVCRPEHLDAIRTFLRLPDADLAERCPRATQSLRDEMRRGAMRVVAFRGDAADAAVLMPREDDAARTERERHDARTYLLILTSRLAREEQNARHQAETGQIPRPLRPGGPEPDVN